MNEMIKSIMSHAHSLLKPSGRGGRASWAKIARFLNYFLTLGFLALALFLFLAPYLADCKFVSIMGGSMSPALSTGSIAFVQPVDSREIGAGDMIAFSPAAAQEPLIVTHRVVEVSDSKGVLSFQTKGDSNNESDRDSVISTDVMGVVRFHLPLVGYLLHFIKQPLGYGLIICLPAFIIILIELRGILRQLDSSKKKKQLLLNKD